MAIKTKTPRVKSKANVIMILSMFLNQQSSKYFLRKTHPKLMWHLRFLDLYTENATWAVQLYALFSTSKRQFQKRVLFKIKRNALVILRIFSNKK
jgi:hypothetical protein